jgi:fatty-acyl-CoA synthase
VVAANVYGVAVPGHGGKCGMAALEISDDFDLAVFRAHVAIRLPAYARPVFLRIVDSLAITETFKQKKSALALEGFDPASINDPLYVENGVGYETLGAAVYARISSGLMRL